MKKMLVLAAMATAMALPAHADEIWNINYAKSHFGPAANTLVLERGKLANPGDTTEAKSASASFLVISGGKVYMAVDEQALASGSPIRAVDYTRWNSMKLVLIGDRLRNADEYCGLRCQSGTPANSITFHFTAVGGKDPSGAMHETLAVNVR